jgi:hypothetical protein
LCHGVPPLVWVNNKEVFYTIRVKETIDKKKCYFFIGGPLLFFYKRQSEAIHYYESFFAVSDDPGYEMSRRVGKLPRSGFVHIESIHNMRKPVISSEISPKFDGVPTTDTACQYLDSV